MRLLRASLVISIALGAAACADQGGTQIVVLNNAVPDDGCVLTAAESGQFLSAGLVDGAGAVATNTVYGYLVAPVIKNISDSADGTLEAERTVILHGARVDLVIGTRPDGSEILDDTTRAELEAAGALQFTVLFSGAVGPDGGLAVLAFDAIPALTVSAVAEALTRAGDRALIQVVYTVFGETTFGSEVEADPFTFPVTVCNGCLVQNLGSCVGLPDADYAPGNSCNLYQDSTAQCCDSSAGFRVCPAVPEDPKDAVN